MKNCTNKKIYSQTIRCAFYLLICFLIQSNLSAQQQPAIKKFDLLFSPAFLTVEKVAVQVGVDIPLTRNYTLLPEIAVSLPFRNDTEFEKVKIFRTSVELKRILKSRVHGNKYVSFQLSYKYRKLINTDGGEYEEKRRDSTFSYSSATVYSPVLGQLLKIGNHFNISNKTYIDIFMGAGIREVFTNYKTNGLRLVERFVPKHGAFPTNPSWQYNYTLVRFHGTIGFRFGIKY